MKVWSLTGLVMNQTVILAWQPNSKWQMVWKEVSAQCQAACLTWGIFLAAGTTLHRRYPPATQSRTLQSFNKVLTFSSAPSCFNTWLVPLLKKVLFDGLASRLVLRIFLIPLHNFGSTLG